MIGIIVSGHGNFGTGLMSSLELIAGNQEHVIPVDFIQEYSVEDLTEKLNAAMDEMKDLDGILVLTDLAGGSPFKTAVVCGLPRQNVEVIAGTNLPLLIEASMSKSFQEDVHAFADGLIQTGKDQVLKFELKEETNEADGDGI